MTGWQGNEGWNPQQDPYGQQYGADPYGQQYGPDPYNPYGTSGTAAYPIYQSGYDAPPPPEPPKRSKLPIVLSIVAILAVVGTVLTIVLLNRDDPQPAAGGSTSPTSSSRPRSTTPRPNLPSSRSAPTSQKVPSKAGWTTITMVGGTYQVPPDWKQQKSPDKRESGLGIDFDAGAVTGEYPCGTANNLYFRGFTASGEVQGKSGTALDLNKTVTDFGTAFAKQYYRDPKLEVPAPTATTVGGQKAAKLTIKVTVTPKEPQCEATSGEVAIIGVEIQKGGKPAGVRMVVVVNDLAGGPADPPALPDPLAEEILGTVSGS